MITTDSGRRSGGLPSAGGSLLSSAAPRAAQGGPRRPDPLAAARAAYGEARAAAEAEWARITRPANDRHNTAIADARAAGTTVPWAEVFAWFEAGVRARNAYEAIVSGPRAVLDEALRDAGLEIFNEH